MIVRILEEGQYEIDDDLGPLLKLDEALEKAVAEGDETGFSTALSSLIAEVRGRGRLLGADELAASDLALPAEGSSIDEVRSLLDSNEA